MRGLLILSVLAVAAMVRPAAPRTRSDPAEDLKQIERDIAAANIRRDKAFFTRVEADEFRFTGSNGSMTTKAEDVAGLDEKPTSTLESYVVDDMTVKVYGRAAVVWGHSTITGHSASGTPYHVESRFTDTFVRRDGRWQIVAGHASRLPATKP